MLKNGLKWGVFGVKMGVFLLFYLTFILSFSINKYRKN
nr:MAG TPA: chitin synthase regulator [Caudoviricetes sp.]